MTEPFAEAPAEAPVEDLSFASINYAAVIAELKVVAASASSVVGFVQKLPLPAQYSVPISVVAGLLKFVQNL